MQATDKELRLLLTNGEIWTLDKLAESPAFPQKSSRRTIERRLKSLDLLPADIKRDQIQDESGTPIHSLLVRDLEQAQNKRHRCLFIQSKERPNGKIILYANDMRGGRIWTTVKNTQQTTISHALAAMQKHIGKEVSFFPHGQITSTLKALARKKALPPSINIALAAYRDETPPKIQKENREKQSIRPTQAGAILNKLESESIFILREAIATAENPVMLYSLGKDSSVLLHLARKAFYPSKLPMPLLHVDTKWKFHDMYTFRDEVAKSSDLELITYTNPDVEEQNINPFIHGSKIHTQIAKTDALKKALDEHQFDIIIGGARRDEEKSRAKERIFSHRSAGHSWDPKNQKPELWNLHNTHRLRGETIRVFPLSNWTERDIWLYIQQENIPIVPLYYAKERAVVERNGSHILVDDDRFQFNAGDKIKKKSIRFRTLGCYPLTSAIESTAQTLGQIIEELEQTDYSERQGRLIDNDVQGSMELKKREGYF